MISTRSLELVIDTVVCLTLAKWETVSGQFGGYLKSKLLSSPVTDNIAERGAAISAMNGMGSDLASVVTFARAGKLH